MHYIVVINLVLGFFKNNDQESDGNKSYKPY